MIEKKYTGIAKQGADVVANPTLDGSEENLESIGINGTNYKVGGINFKHSLNEYGYVSEEEADIILNLSDFTNEKKSNGFNKYSINLKASEINGKKIRFYYDRTNLFNELDSSANNNKFLKFTIYVENDCDIDKHTYIYMEYYGGVDSNFTCLTIMDFDITTISPIVFTNHNDEELKSYFFYNFLNYYTAQNYGNLNVFCHISNSFNNLISYDPDI